MSPMSFQHPPSPSPLCSSSFASLVVMIPTNPCQPYWHCWHPIDILNVLTSFWHPWHPLLPLLLCLSTFLIFVNIHSVSCPPFQHNIVLNIAWTRSKHPLDSNAMDLDHNLFLNFKCCKNILIIHIFHQFISFNTSFYQWQPTYPNVTH